MTAHYQQLCQQDGTLVQSRNAGLDRILNQRFCIYASYLKNSHKYATI